MNLDEHLRHIYDEHYPGLAADGTAPHPLEWLRVGYYRGLKDGQKVRTEAAELAVASREKTIRDAGYASGLAYAAWVASNVPGEAPTPAGVKESILEALEAAAKGARIRAEAVQG